VTDENAIAFDSPQAIVERGLQLLGADRGTIVVERVEEANLRWANSTLTTNGVTARTAVHVAALPRLDGGLGAGSASGMVSGVADLAALVERARAAGRDSGPAADQAPDVPPGAPDLTWDAPPEGTSADELIPVSTLLGDVLPGGGDVAYFGYAEHSVASTYLGTTAGIRRRHVQPTSRFELCGKSAGGTRSAWAGRSGRHFAGIDLAATATEVGLGLGAQATHIDVPAGRQRVILSPSAVADLLVYLMWSASALDAVEGRSAFSRPGGGTRVGERLTEVPFHIASDPRAPGLECPDHVLDTVSSGLTSAFDAGLPIGPTPWIDTGELVALPTTRHSASLTGAYDTPMADNLLSGVSGRQGSLAELATRVGDGLLITCLWYIREVEAQSLLLTGLTRDGVYVVRDGAIVGAAGNYRFNASPLGMLKHIIDAGEPADCLPREWADWFTRARVAPLAIDGFNLSTPSEAI
jgi:predicted Zn-dependent protease